MIPPCGFVFGGHLKHTQDFSSVQSFSFVRNLFYVINDYDFCRRPRGLGISQVLPDLHTYDALETCPSCGSPKLATLHSQKSLDF